MAIIRNHRLEYEVGQIDVTYPENHKETYFGSVPVIVPNNWTPPKPPPQPGKMPVKGDLITLDAKQYRVLKVNKNIAEVICMYDTTTSQKFDAHNGVANVYADNSLDVYCNETFYGTLSATMKAAIVEKTFTQDEWSYAKGSSSITGTKIYQAVDSSSNQYRIALTNAAKGDSISRNCYVLSVQDVIDYLEVTTDMTVSNTTLTALNVWKMFWNKTTANSQDAWLRSASYNTVSTGYAFIAFGQTGDVASGGIQYAHAVRPAFQIDLSKIDFKE